MTAAFRRWWERGDAHSSGGVRAAPDGVPHFNALACFVPDVSDFVAAHDLAEETNAWRWSQQNKAYQDAPVKFVVELRRRSLRGTWTAPARNVHVLQRSRSESNRRRRPRLLQPDQPALGHEHADDAATGTQTLPAQRVGGGEQDADAVATSPTPSDRTSADYSHDAHHDDAIGGPDQLAVGKGAGQRRMRGRSFAAQVQEIAEAARRAAVSASPDLDGLARGPRRSKRLRRQ